MVPDVDGLLRQSASELVRLPHAAVANAVGARLHRSAARSIRSTLGASARRRCRGNRARDPPRSWGWHRSARRPGDRRGGLRSRRLTVRPTSARLTSSSSPAGSATGTGAGRWSSRPCGGEPADRSGQASAAPRWARLRPRAARTALDPARPSV